MGGSKIRQFPRIEPPHPDPLPGRGFLVLARGGCGDRYRGAEPTLMELSEDDSELLDSSFGFRLNMFFQRIEPGH